MNYGLDDGQWWASWSTSKIIAQTWDNDVIIPYCKHNINEMIVVDFNILIKGKWIKKGFNWINDLGFYEDWVVLEEYEKVVAIVKEEWKGKGGDMITKL